MVTMISGWKHEIGMDCSSVAIRNILETRGFSELGQEVYLGLGCGLDFAYNRTDQEPSIKSYRAPHWLVSGRGILPHREAANALGILVDEQTHSSAEEAWAHMLEYLHEGRPVIVDVDLQEYQHDLKWPSNANLLDFTQFINFRTGGHNTVLIGYDEDRDTVYLAENLLTQIQEIPREVFLRAACSPTAYFKSSYKTTVFYVPDRLMNKEAALQAQIRKNVHRMLHPYLPELGYPAMERFATDLPHWPELMNDDHMFKGSVFVMYIMSEILGGGGGLFRRMYGRFIRSVSKLLDEPALVDVAIAYGELSKKWTRLIGMVRESTESTMPQEILQSPDLLDLLHTILWEEKAVLLELERVSNRW